MIVVDTSFVYALLDRRDARHREAAEWYASSGDDVATTPLVLAEVDHLAGARAGPAARSAFRADLAAGAYDVSWWADAAHQAVEVAERYADLGLDLTDASLVVLAARIGTTAIATFDEGHFRAVTPLFDAPAFTLLPTDA